MRGRPILSHRSVRLAICLALGIVLQASAPAAAEIVVHAPEEVLSRWTVEEDGRLFFNGPEGDRWELIPSVDDPAIRNKGQGSFFPLDPRVVRDALDAIHMPGEILSADVFILPYPRRNLLASSAGKLTVYLSPGVVPVGERQVHQIVAHEIGHIVHNQFLPDRDVEGWMAYRKLRGIEDASVYSARADHRNRPHEIFAEDFRFLFGGKTANYSGTIENTDLPLPDTVPGLREFFLGLADPRRLRLIHPTQPLFAYPNPARGPVRFDLTGAASGETGAASLEVFDVQGRRVAVRENGNDEPGWDGRSDAGGRVTPGLYFLKLRRAGQVWAGKVLVQP